jgi:hypothetical protein
MKTFLVMAVILVSCAVQAAPPIVRNSITTNSSLPIIVTGTNASFTGKISANSLTVTNAATTATLNADALALSEWNIGTIANGGTAALVLSTNVSRAIYSGATATITLPTITLTNNSYQLVHFGTNTSGGSQIITIPSLLRGELGTAVLVTTITNNSGAGFRIMFESVAGVWRDVSAIGDALTLSGGTVTPSSTDDFTNKTLDAASTGNVLKFKSYLKFNFPRRVDGAGCTYPNTNDVTANTFMVPRFSGSAATNANFCRFAVRVPKDIDTGVVPTASLTVRLSAADTGAHIYNVAFASVANSAVSTATVGTWIKLDVAADASGASDDVESVSNVALTGWNSGLTAGRFWVIELNRDGATDASTIASDLLELEIEYPVTQ